MPSFLDLGACIIMPLSTGLPQTSFCTGPSFSLPLGSFGLALPLLQFCHFILRNNYGCGVDRSFLASVHPKPERGSHPSALADARDGLGEKLGPGVDRRLVPASGGAGAGWWDWRAEASRRAEGKREEGLGGSWGCFFSEAGRPWVSREHVPMSTDHVAGTGPRARDEAKG